MKEYRRRRRSESLEGRREIERLERRRERVRDWREGGGGGGRQEGFTFFLFSLILDQSPDIAHICRSLQASPTTRTFYAPHSILYIHYTILLTHTHTHKHTDAPTRQ